MNDKQRKALIFLATNYVLTVLLLDWTLFGLLMIGSFILWDAVLLTLPIRIYAILFRATLIFALITTLLGLWVIDSTD